MKVEQRIGRLDRFGQQSPKIRIYNLVISDSVEERIFWRLYQRIGIFEQSVGDLETILGEEIRRLTKNIFSARLSPEQEIEQAQQAADAIIRRRQELEEFDKQRLKPVTFSPDTARERKLVEFVTLRHPLPAQRFSSGETRRCKDCQ